MSDNVIPSKFELKLTLENAAFDDDIEGGFELARILKDIARDIEEQQMRMDSAITLRDYNGNPVGTADWWEKD